jgi:hypothetical protein
MVRLDIFIWASIGGALSNYLFHMLLSQVAGMSRYINRISFGVRREVSKYFGLEYSIHT